MTATRHPDEIDPIVPELPPEPRPDDGRHPTRRSSRPSRQSRDPPPREIEPLVPDLR